MDLDLLLVGPARPVGNEIGGRRRHRPPTLGQAAHAEVEVVDHVGLIADQPEDRRPRARLHLDRHGLRRRALAVDPAQRQRGGATRRGGGACIVRRTGRTGASTRSRRGDGSERRARVSVLHGLGRIGRLGRLLADSATATWPAAGAGTARTCPVGSQRRYSPQTQKSASSGFSRPHAPQILTRHLLPRAPPRGRAAGRRRAPAWPGRSGARPPPVCSRRVACRSR